GSSIFLSRIFGCQVEGITLSTKQVNYATQKGIQFGVSGKVNFTVGNYLDTKFPDNYFDVVWAIESVCHAPEKGDFIKEAYRVLNKGGRLIIADFFSNLTGSSGDKNNLLKKWAQS